LFREFGREMRGHPYLCQSTSLREEVLIEEVGGRHGEGKEGKEVRVKMRSDEMVLGRVCK